MLIYYLECLAEEIKDFFWTFVCWIGIYVLAQYLGLRGPFGADLALFLPFIFVRIVFNAYMRFVDEYDV